MQGDLAEVASIFRGALYWWYLWLDVTSTAISLLEKRGRGYDCFVVLYGHGLC